MRSDLDPMGGGGGRRPQRIHRRSRLRLRQWDPDAIVVGAVDLTTWGGRRRMQPPPSPEVEDACPEAHWRWRRLAAVTGEQVEEHLRGGEHQRLPPCSPLLSHLTDHDTGPIRLLVGATT